MYSVRRNVVDGGCVVVRKSKFEYLNYKLFISCSHHKNECLLVGVQKVLK